MTANEVGPLAGMRVLDISQNVAGPYCTMHLADLGAEVVKVEPPGSGDNARSFGPPYVDGTGVGFHTLNRNKTSVAVDLKQPEGKDIVRRLLHDSDVLVQSSRPGALARLGFGYADCAALRPALVYCSISGFGRSSPYESRAGLDLVAQGMSGIMSVTGFADGPPAKSGVPVTDLATGLLACVSILSAYHAATISGCGQEIDVSLMDAGLSLSLWELSAVLADERSVRGRTGNTHRASAPYDCYPTRDGSVTIGAASQRLFEGLCHALDLDALPSDPRFATNADRMHALSELTQILSERTRVLDTAELLERLDRAGVPCGPVLDYAQVVADPHLVAREMAVTVGGEDGRPAQRVIGSPLKLSGTPARVRTPAPQLGQDTVAVLAALGYSEADVESLLERGVCASS